MSTASAQPSPPVAKKVIVGFLGYAAATIIQVVVPGYHPDPVVAQLIDAVVGTGAAFVVREELKYLVPALKKAEQYEDGI